MLRMWISRGLLGGSVAVIVVVGTLVPLAIVDPWIGISMAAVLSCGAAISLTNGKRMRSATRTMRRRRSLVTGVIDEQINALEVVQVSGRAPGEHSRLSRQNVMLNRSLCRVAELRGRLRGIADGTGLLTLVAVLAVGLVEVRRGYASVGLVVAAVSATRLLDGPVRTLGLAHDYSASGTGLTRKDSRLPPELQSRTGSCGARTAHGPPRHDRVPGRDRGRRTGLSDVDRSGR